MSIFIQQLTYLARLLGIELWKKGNHVQHNIEIDPHRYAQHRSSDMKETCIDSKFNIAWRQDVTSHDSCSKSSRSSPKVSGLYNFERTLVITTTSMFIYSFDVLEYVFEPKAAIFKKLKTWKTRSET